MHRPLLHVITAGRRAPAAPAPIIKPVALPRPAPNIFAMRFVLPRFVRPAWLAVAAVAIVAVVAGCQPAAKQTLAMKTNSAPETGSTPTAGALNSGPPPAGAPADVVRRTDEEWRRILTPEQYRVLRQAGTERAFGAAYEEFKQQGAGTYVCAGCGAELFSSKEKFDSHCGWPSFYDPANARNVKTTDDFSGGMVRTEVTCAKCNGHLGHVFKGEG